MRVGYSSIYYYELLLLPSIQIVHKIMEFKQHVNLMGEVELSLPVMC